MNHRWLRYASSLLALSAAAESAAEPSSPVTSSPPFILPSGSIPATIYGNACLKEEGGAVLATRLERLVCKSDVIKTPSTIVSVVESQCGWTWQQMAETRRNSINDGTPVFKVVWQEPFTPPSVSGGVGYRGFYQTGMGNRYWWETCGQGRLTRVSVIMFAPLDNDALKAEIEEKVFGIGRQIPLARQESNP